MTTKLEQAARQIIVDWDSGIHLYEAITSLREALAEQDGGSVCARCGGIVYDPVIEQAEQEPLMIAPGGGAFPFAVVGEFEQAEQEPVAWTYTRKGIYDKLTELGASITKSCCNVPDKRCGADEWVLQTVQIELLLDALPAPVRTKDLTDDELREIHHLDQFGLFCDYDDFEQIARAVIAKDREKNK